MHRFSWTDVCARRLTQHGLSAPLDAQPVDVVSAMAGTHAQVQSAAELGIALRLKEATRADVQQAQGLVKTFGQRGTVHLLPAAELPMWLGAFAAIPPGPNPWEEHVRMTDEQTETVFAAIGTALAGKELTIDELTSALVDLAGPWAADRVMPAFQDYWPRWRTVTHLAAVRGVLCFGANKGRKVTYTNPGVTPAPAAQSLEHVVRSYLRSYGPSTPQRFTHWLSAPIKWATEVFSSIDLEEVTVEGSSAWVLPGDTAVPEVVECVRLLPYFDVYSYRVGNHPLLYPGKAKDRVMSGNFQNLIVNGTVAGLWHQRKSGRRVDITVETLVKLTKKQRAELDSQAQRVAEIIGATPTVTYAPVTVGSHA
ncbi:winged helix DNA-binding domain-containing protein [Kibdelosporangium philippinense]|uniref:Winged helix DNA-binding domain-containing protein n=1 Tax=Kibdelosporangium philippinense TaxID=211113 RepID=A0ABS8ZLG3_9PSEU|nr:winged helix DNA-binding domain-containing protein [Kibdelosporangium philippinense]MCE7008332.1 winged helix DNA-binding domain-containing protein [Kibdelosporangium philippinense]